MSCVFLLKPNEDASATVVGLFLVSIRHRSTENKPYASMHRARSYAPSAAGSSPPRARVLACCFALNARATCVDCVSSQNRIMALFSLTLPMGFHGVHMAPSTSIRMGFLDGKPSTAVAIPADLIGQGPFGIFDPLGLAPESVDQLRLFREAELAHGRVAMVAAVGFLVQEGFHPMFAVTGPVIRQLDEVLTYSNGMLGSSILLMATMFAELKRARIGWVEPEVKLPIATQEVQANVIAGFHQCPIDVLSTQVALGLSLQDRQYV